MVIDVYIQQTLDLRDLSMKELEIWKVIHEIKSNRIDIHTAQKNMISRCGFEDPNGLSNDKMLNIKVVGIVKSVDLDLWNA